MQCFVQRSDLCNLVYRLSSVARIYGASSILFFLPPKEWMSDIWIRRRRLGSAQRSIADAASARNISSNIFACTAYCQGFITDERPRTNIGGK
ncbi:hypothetical protein EVAR_83309_1 [Eumeta japonica]|uniref:Uncharacterized protein n=1 Tax=Eumeta variegata TaxID=151549 RepID=A0A4C1VWQ9_EUMVA|nr:hypothetical protein EVAR_83309_1 [Eumeta japonica]